MEKREIIERAINLKDKNDLLQLLNDVVADELGNSHSFSFSMRQLSYYCNPNNVKGRYHQFDIPKKSGGEPRHISAPSKGLSHILHYVNIILKAIYQPSDYAMGFVEGRNVVDNASRHIGQNYVFNTDLENFFPSIEQARVWKRFQLPPFNFSQKIASVLAGLCCIRKDLGDGNFSYILPQGAPTSPLVTNAICDKLDRKLCGLARRLGLHYSRYADDITFSSMHNVYQEGGTFQTELKHVIEGQGFHMNERKTRLQKLGQRQEVTGLVVSNRVNTSKEYIAGIRNILHIWEKYGYNDAYKRFYPKYKADKGSVKSGEPMLENVLYGKLQYLKMVKGAKDSVYVALQARYDRLTSPVHANVKQKLDYLRSFTIDEFEEVVGSTISYHQSKEGSLYGEVEIAGRNVTISITNEAKNQLVKKQIITDPQLVKNVKPAKFTVQTSSHPELFVVLTAKKGKSPFWLMTYSDPTVSILDSSEVPVSKLLDLWEEKGIDAAMQAYEEGIVLSLGKEQEQKQKKRKSSAKQSTPGKDFSDLKLVESDDFELLDNYSTLSLDDL